MAEEKDLERFVQRFANWLRSTTAFVFEARASRLLEPRLDFWVRGAECGQVDCGIVVAERPFLGTKAAYPLGQLLRDFSDDECIVPLDFKTIRPKGGMLEKGGLYHYAIVHRPSQQHCFAFIIGNPSTPNLVAVVPQYYLNHRYEDARYQDTYYGRDMPLHDCTVEPFPPEWTPFVMPMESLANSMESLYRFASGLEPVFINPYTGVRFLGCPRPKLFTPDLLYPTPSSGTRDDPFIQRTIEAVTNHSKLYDGGRLEIRPLCGDFYLRHKSSGIRVVVEHKRNTADVIRDNVISIKMGWNLRKEITKPYFTALTAWDWMLIELSTPPRQLLMLSRDDLPIEMFQPPQAPDQDDIRYHWKTTPAFLKQHILPCDPPEVFVSRLESLLNAYSQQGSLLASRAIIRRNWIKEDSSATTLNIKRIKKNQIIKDIEDDREPAKVEVRGSGPRWAPNIFIAEQEHWLRKQCTILGRGAVYRVGKHPSGTHLFSPCIANSFAELHPSTPVIFLNFATVGNLENEQTTDRRRPRWLFHATHGMTPSVYFLDPVPERMVAVPHARYIVPSSLLNVPTLREYNQKIMDGAAKSEDNRGAKNPIILANHEHIEDFSTPEDRVVSVLMQFFDNGRSVRSADQARSIPCGQTQIDFSLYLRTVRQVRQQFISMSNGVSFLDYLDYD